MTRRRSPITPRVHRLPVRVVPGYSLPHEPVPEPTVSFRRRPNRTQRAQAAMVAIGFILVGVIALWVVTVGRSLLRPASGESLLSRFKADVSDAFRRQAPAFDEADELHDRVFPNLP